MARVRHIRIRNFRGIGALDWFPSRGLNCLIGSGDGGKTTILDAIDLCIGARRTAQFSDADFHQLNPAQPISIQVTLGELPDALRSMEGYGAYGNWRRRCDRMRMVSCGTSRCHTSLLSRSLGNIGWYAGPLQTIEHELPFVTGRNWEGTSMKRGREARPDGADFFDRQVFHNGSSQRHTASLARRSPGLAWA